MKTNQYIGSRYVPKILGEWNRQEIYEGLSVVLYEGDSYTSKKIVPMGVDILNEEYWVCTGNYNVQIESYREQVNQHRILVEEYKEVTDSINNTGHYAYTGDDIVEEMIKNNAETYHNEPAITGHGYVGFHKKFTFPTKIITISKPIRLNYYNQIDGQRAVIRTTPDFVGEACIIAANGSGWLSDIKNITFDTKVPALKYESNNLEAGMVDLTGCWFVNNAKAISLSAQSSITNIRGNRFLNCPVVLDCPAGDEVIFKYNWVTEEVPTVNEQTSFIFKGNTLVMDNNMMIPAPNTNNVSGHAWVDMYGRRLIIERNNFGGEGGNHTVVNWRSLNKPSAAPSYTHIEAGLYLRDNKLWSGVGFGVVRLFMIPNKFVMTDNLGFAHEGTTMVWGGVSSDIIAASGGLKDKFLKIEDNFGTNGKENFVLPELTSCLARSEKQKFHRSVDTLKPLQNTLSVANNIGKRKFDIGLKENMDKNSDFKIYNLEIVTNTSVGSTLYKGHYKGYLYISCEYIGSSIQYKVNLVEVLNYSNTGEKYTVDVHFGDDILNKTINAQGALDRLLTVQINKCVSGLVKIWDTTDGAFIL